MVIRCNVNFRVLYVVNKLSTLSYVLIFGVASQPQTGVVLCMCYNDWKHMPAGTA